MTWLNVADEALKANLTTILSQLTFLRPILENFLSLSSGLNEKLQLLWYQGTGEKTTVLRLNSIQVEHFFNQKWIRQQSFYIYT